MYLAGPQRSAKFSDLAKSTTHRHSSIPLAGIQTHAVFRWHSIAKYTKRENWVYIVVTVWVREYFPYGVIFVLLKIICKSWWVCYLHLHPYFHHRNHIIYDIITINTITILIIIIIIPIITIITITILILIIYRVLLDIYNLLLYKGFHTKKFKYISLNNTQTL